jgi:chromosomal replication initiation ATPase DnaA
MTTTEIISTVASYYGVPVSGIVTPRKTSGAAGHARRIAMFLSKMHTDQNWTEIGKVFGKHRTSVMEAARAVSEDHDERVARELAAIERRLLE